MLGGEGNRHPIQLVVNYWERRPKVMRARLDELLHNGISHIVSFVPWQAVESDISHTLVRFLQAVADKRMTVSLVVTPELGVHYPNSGFPKDVLSKKDNLAVYPQGAGAGGVPVVGLAPNSFPLPSLFAPEFAKRYHSYLARIDGFLADVGRTQPELLKGVCLITTGSLWKYYRSPAVAASSPFSGVAGDVSNSGNMSFRRRVEEFFSQREFADPNLAAANRWKTRNLEDTNRRWFLQQSEDAFRTRSLQHLRRKSTYIPADEIELFTPEADPALFYSSILQMLSGGSADFEALSEMVDEYAARDSRGAPNIHWSGLGSFQKLSDPEKQFLILKSLLLMGGRGGGILVDSGDWFALSQAFRSRVESLARSLAAGDLKCRARALYLAPHLWSGVGSVLWQDLRNSVGQSARMVSSVDLVLRERNAEVLIVDPQFIFTRDNILKLMSWAKGGRTLLVPRSALYTESARAELEAVLSSSQRIEMALGVPYQLHGIGEGKLFICEYGEGSKTDEALPRWQAFLASLLSVGGVQGHCKVSDARLAAIPLERRGGGLGLFVLNGTRAKVSGDIIFDSPVRVSDLAVALSARAGEAPGTDESPRFSLEVPGCGIFPLAIDGQQFADLEERFVAADMASALRVDESELPGLEDSAWN